MTKVQIVQFNLIRCCCCLQFFFATLITWRNFFAAVAKVVNLIMQKTLRMFSVATTIAKNSRDNFFSLHASESNCTQEKLKTQLWHVCLRKGGSERERERVRERVYRKQTYFNFCLFTLIRFALCLFWTRPSFFQTCAPPLFVPKKKLSRKIFRLKTT